MDLLIWESPGESSLRRIGIRSSSLCGTDELQTNIGNVSTLDDSVAAFNSTKRIKGKTIVCVRP